MDRWHQSRAQARERSSGSCFLLTIRVEPHGWADTERASAIAGELEGVMIELSKDLTETKNLRQTRQLTTQIPLRLTLTDLKLSQTLEIW